MPLMTQNITCWTLIPGPAAFHKQTAGVADALGVNYVVKKVNRNKPWCWLPKQCTVGALKQLRADSDQLEPPWPDLIISCGQYTIPYALAIRKANRGHTACY